MSKIKRNDPCFCGSGKKYKKCCGQNKGLSQRTISPISTEQSLGKMDQLRNRLQKSAIPPRKEEVPNLSDRIQNSEKQPSKEE